MTRALYQDFSFVYLLEAFNRLLASHHVFKFIFPWCFPQWQAVWPPSATITPSSSQKMEFRCLRTASVRHQNSNYNEFCASGSERGRGAARAVALSTFDHVTPTEARHHTLGSHPSLSTRLLHPRCQTNHDRHFSSISQVLRPKTR